MGDISLTPSAQQNKMMAVGVVVQDAELLNGEGMLTDPMATTLDHNNLRSSRRLAAGKRRVFPEGMMFAVSSTRAAVQIGHMSGSMSL